MKDALAEKLLARVMGWDPTQMAEERPYLQAMAAYKYDEYQQFSPGIRFIESLARWLDQFQSHDERRVAYRFVKERMIFCSSAEMAHFVETAYPEHIRPYLLRRAAAELNVNPRHAAKVAASSAFQIFQRQCLFLGLSDGARIDAFRRANNADLDHEQIWQTHELSAPRVEEMLEKLAEHLARLGAPTGKRRRHRFRTLVLLDDFSASGSSYYMPKPDGGVGGKVAKFFRGLTSKRSDPLRKLVDLRDLEVIILLYTATQGAWDHLRDHSTKLWGSAGIRSYVEVVQMLPSQVRLAKGDGDPMGPLIDQYYDHAGVWDSHLEKGGTEEAKYGYAAGGLPVVLHHNTPNNSIVLLWSYEGAAIRGLFPRVKRHKELP